MISYTFFSKSILIFILLYLSTGCGFLKPHVVTYKEMKERINFLEKRYPSQDYLTAFGRGDSIKNTEQDAQIQIANSIKSEIKGVVRSYERFETVGNRSSNQGLQEIEFTQKTQFRHAELIRLHQSASQCQQSNCIAFAYISRIDLAQRIEEEYNPLEQRFYRTIQYLQKEEAS